MTTQTSRTSLTSPRECLSCDAPISGLRTRCDRCEEERTALLALVNNTRPRRFKRWQAAILYLVLIGLGIAFALPWGEVVWAWLLMVKP